MTDDERVKEIIEWWENHPDVPPLCKYWEEATDCLLSLLKKERMEKKELEEKIKELTKPDFLYWYEENQQSLLRIRTLEARIKGLEEGIRKWLGGGSGEEDDCKYFRKLVGE